MFVRLCVSSLYRGQEWYKVSKSSQCSNLKLNNASLMRKKKEKKFLWSLTFLFAIVGAISGIVNGIVRNSWEGQLVLVVLFVPPLLAFSSLVVFPTYKDATSKDSQVKRTNFTIRA